MKKILTLVIISLLFLSTFLIIAPQIKADIPPDSSEKGIPVSEAKEEPTNSFLLSGLYAGSTNPGKVWKYKGGTSWESITDQPLELGWSVTSIVEFGGKLYAATISDPDIYSSSGKVYRYDGSKTWTSVVNGLTANQVTFLVVYKGNLYAGTATPSRLYKYDPATTSWIKVLEYAPWFGFRSAYVWGDWLYLGEWYWDRFGRWDGTTFQEFQPYYWGSCIYSFEEYGDYLYAGAYGGTIYRVTYEPPTATSIWSPPQWQYAWTLKAYKNKLYIGFDAGGTGSAPLYKYDANLERVYDTPVWNYATTTSNPHEGIISMASDETYPMVPNRPYLYIGVGGQAIGYPTYMSGEGVGQVYKYDGVNPPELISNGLGSGVQALYYVPRLPLKLRSLGEFNFTFYYCVYNSELEGTQTYAMTLPDKRPGHEGEFITLDLKASFWFGGRGVRQQGTGRTGADGLYVKWIRGGGRFITIDENDPYWRYVVKKRYEKLGITDFTGFETWPGPEGGIRKALEFPEQVEYWIVEHITGGATNLQLVPWYSIAAPWSLLAGSTGYIEFTTGDTLTPPVTPSGKTWISFKVDDRGGAIKGRRIDVYLGEGNQAALKWVQTGDNRKGIVYVLQRSVGLGP